MTPAANVFVLNYFDDLLATPEAVEQLDQTILQLAVQGRLVPQNPKDEPASELLKRIRAEKERLVEEGRLPKDKPLPPVRDDEKPFELPKGWEWTRLGEMLMALQTGPFGSNLHKSDYVSNGIPVVNPSNMQAGRIVANSQMTISEKTRERLNQYILEVGDMVVARRGEMGRCAIVTEQEAGWLCGTGSLRMRLSDTVLKEFVVSLFQSELVRTYLVGGSVGITMSNLGQRALAYLPIALPPFAEQRRIVARIEQLFAQTRRLAELLSRAQADLTRLNESAIAHLLDAQTPEEFAAHWAFIAKHFDLLYSEPAYVAPLRQVILELAVRGKLTHQDLQDEPASELLKRIRAEKERLIEEGKIPERDPLPPIRSSEKPFEVPEGWEWARLGEMLIALQTGPFGSNLHKSDYASNGIPVVNPSNMQAGRIVANSQMTISEKTRERLSQYILEAGDLVIARRGEMGRCALVTEREAGWLCGTGNLRMRLSDNVPKEFVVLLFQSEFVRTYLVGGSVGITMSNLGQRTLAYLPIALPPVAEQYRIVARVEQLMGLCDALEAKLRAAQVEREWLVEAVVQQIALGTADNRT